MYRYRHDRGEMVVKYGVKHRVQQKKCFLNLKQVYKSMLQGQYRHNTAQDKSLLE